MSDEHFIDPDEVSVEQLAGEVDELRTQLDEFRRRAVIRDELAELSLRPMPEPEPEYVEPLIAQPLPRPPLPRVGPAQTQVLTQAALARVAGADPRWHEMSEQVMEQVKGAPERFGQLVMQGDPIAVAGYLSSVAHQERSRNDTRAMKLSAQTAVGASGRPQPLSDAAAEWAAIREASPARYWD